MGKNVFSIILAEFNSIYLKSLYFYVKKVIIKNKNHNSDITSLLLFNLLHFPG